MGSVIVHPRVMERHPELTEGDVLEAWEGYVRLTRRDGADGYYVAVGFDKRARAVEMVAVETIDGDWYIFHAMTPPTKGVLRELGLTR